MVNLTLIKKKRVNFWKKLNWFCLLFLFSPIVFSQVGPLKLVQLDTSKPQEVIPVTQIAVSELPQYLSPYADIPLGEQYAHLFFDPLVRWSGKKGIENRLVKSWNHKKKGRVRFYLKRNIKFHSGFSLTSQDIFWTFKHLQNYKKSKQLFSSIDKIKVIDKYTFDIYTKETENDLLDLLTHLFILDARFYRKYKISSNQKYGILYAESKSSNRLLLPISGTGPFKVNSFNTRLHLKVEKYNAYWGAESFFPLLNFVLIKSDESRVYSLIAGDVSVGENISNVLIDTINKSKHHSIIQSPYLYSTSLTMNTNKVPAFQEESARYALQLTINRQGIVDHVLKGYGGIESSLLLEMTDQKTTDKTSKKSDLKNAKSLFKKALVPNYLSLLVMDTKLSTTQKTVDALFNMLHRADIRLIIKHVSSKEAWDKNKGKYDLLLSVNERFFVEKSNQCKALFTSSYLAPVLNKDFIINNETLSIKQCTDQIVLKVDKKLIIPLYYQPLLYAADNKLNLNEIFSENGIPYWSALRFKNDQTGETK